MSSLDFGEYSSGYLTFFPLSSRGGEDSIVRSKGQPYLKYKKSMISLQKSFQKYQIKKPEKVLNERAALVKEFLDTLNADRKPPFKPLTPARVGMLLAPVKTKDLYAFLADCKYAKNFSSYFWWSVNPKKH